MAEEDREERIRRRAYSIWEQEGRPDGRAEEHWNRAMREVTVAPAGEARRDDSLGGTAEGDGGASAVPSARKGMPPKGKRKGQDSGPQMKTGPGRRDGSSTTAVNNGNFADTSEEAVEGPSTNGIR